MKRSIDLNYGRQAFGADPGAYHAARPAYPDWVFKILRDRCGLKHDMAVFEIGAGRVAGGQWSGMNSATPIAQIRSMKQRRFCLTALTVRVKAMAFCLFLPDSTGLSRVT